MARVSRQREGEKWEENYIQIECIVELGALSHLPFLLLVLWAVYAYDVQAHNMCMCVCVCVYVYVFVCVAAPPYKFKSDFDFMVSRTCVDVGEAGTTAHYVWRTVLDCTRDVGKMHLSLSSALAADVSDGVNNLIRITLSVCSCVKREWERVYV